MGELRLELSMEQQFELRKIEELAKSVDREKLEELVIDAHRLLMMKDNAFRSVLKGA
jgi:adenylate kinase